MNKDRALAAVVDYVCCNSNGSWCGKLCNLSNVVALQ